MLYLKRQRIQYICICVCVLTLVQLFVTPWTTAHQASLSMGFPRQEYWSGLPFPSPIYMCVCVCVCVCVCIWRDRMTYSAWIDWGSRFLGLENMFPLNIYQHILLYNTAYYHYSFSRLCNLWEETQQNSERDLVKPSLNILISSLQLSLLLVQKACLSSCTQCDF